MTITTTNLTRAAGISAATAGAIFIAVQIKHPAWNVAAFTDSMSWQIRSIAKLVMCGLAIAGLTGMYLHQRRRVGALGLAGYLVFAAGYLLMSSVEAIAAFVLPTLAHTEPGYVNDVLRASAGETPAGDIGALQTLFNLVGVFYMAGGLLFGIAMFRARVLARWAAALLAVGTVSTAALSVLPASFDRPFAVPAGLALIGLGVSLWRTQRVSDSAVASVVAAPAAVVPAGADR
jgi:hypothetical protein